MIQSNNETSSDFNMWNIECVFAHMIRCGFQTRNSIIAHRIDDKFQSSSNLIENKSKTRTHHTRTHFGWKSKPNRTVINNEILNSFDIYSFISRPMCVLERPFRLVANAFTSTHNRRLSNGISAKPASALRLLLGVVSVSFTSNE